MGKRKPELTKLTNKELIESALKQIQELGYTIQDVKLGNCYFLFEDEDDSICHFKIKEIPGFLFAFWNTCRFDTIEYQIEKNGYGETWADSLHINPKSELVFFTQYERELDKFKPSRSGFVTGIYRQAWFESKQENQEDMIRKEEWYMYDLEDILEFMKKHPIKSYVYSMNQSINIWDEISNYKALKLFITDWYCDKKHKLINYLKLKRDTYCSLKFVKKLKTMNVIVFDRGENWSPRLQISLRRRKPLILEQYEQDLDLIDTFEEKHFNKGVSIDLWDENINENSTKEDLDKDKDLEERYFKMIETIRKSDEDSDDNYKIIYMDVEYKYDK